LLRQGEAERKGNWLVKGSYFFARKKEVDGGNFFACGKIQPLAPLQAITGKVNYLILYEVKQRQ